MTRDRSVGERISAWLLEGAPDQLPDRVLRATFERTRPTRQRRTFIGWRHYPMIRVSPAAIAVGAAAIAVLAVGVALLPRSNPSVGGGSSAPPTLSPNPSPSPTLAPITGLPGRFAFSSNRSGNGEIYVMNPDRTDLRQLTNDPAEDKLPSWSPDSSKILFTSSRTGDEEIWVMNADGSGQTQLTTNVNGGWARWSPDGSQVVVAARAPSPDSLYLIPIDGGEPRILINPRDHGLQLAVDPFWAPGDRIGFTGLAGEFSDLYTVAADGTDVRQLTTTAAEDGSASWSPDGRWVAFQSDEGGGCIYRLGADGSGLIRLTEGCTQGFMTTWSPDGTKIGWAGGSHGPDDIHVMTANGSDEVVLTTTRDIRDLSWGIAP
jgi:Tol biopolymer transport system component